MEFVRNPRLEAEIYDRLGKEYLTERKEFPHVTQVVYCLTRSWRDLIMPKPLTDKEKVLFAVGWGLERVMLPQTKIESVKVGTLWMTPDFISLQDGPADLKTTRAYPGADGLPKKGPPETWIEQFKAYSVKFGKPRPDGSVEFSVVIVYLNPAELVAGTFIFTQEELKKNWDYLEERAAVLIASIESFKPPTPFKYNKVWECEHCRYLADCLAWKERS